MPHSRLLLAALVVAGAAVTAGAAGAQQPASGQRPLTQDDWDRWRSIVAPALSRDGQWVAYSLHPQVGDGELVVRSTTTPTEYRVPRGFVGRPQLVAGAQPDSSGGVPPAQLTADSRWALALTYATKAEYDRARRASRRPADQPKASLALVRLADGQVTTVPRVRSFRLPRDAGGWVAYLLEADSAAAAPARAVGDSAAARPSGQAGQAGQRRREYGTTLVLRELATGRETRIPDVLAYAFDNGGRWLGYTVSSRIAGRDGAYVRALATCASGDCAERALASGAGEYRGLTFDRAGGQVAFLSTRDDQAAAKPRYALYHASLRGGAAAPVVRAGTWGDTLLVAENGRVDFVREGGAVIFGVAPAPLDTIPADSLSDKAIVDLWHWRDARLQPQQQREAGRERGRSYTAIWHVGAARPVRLANDSMPTVTVSDDGRVALAATNVPYQVEQMWGDGGSDVWVIDARTGARRRVAARVDGPAQLSAGARYAIWWNDGQWWTAPTAGGEAVAITAAARGVRFAEEEHDTPDEPGPYGLGGWTAGDQAVLVHDRFDVWEVDPAGRRAPRVVTDSLGRREGIALRVAQVDPEARTVDASKPLLLRAFHETTKAAGFYQDRVAGEGRPERIVMADAWFGAMQKAKDAERYVVTKGTFTQFPDLHAGSTLAGLTRISDANPQQQEYRWGTVELVRWLSTDGVPLQGLLFKPAGFDSTKKYPMIAYFYERLSNNLHQYVAPFGRNVINPTHYTSNGYLIFEPDIVYEEGYPGPSAMKSIVPGVQMLVARGFVDPQAIGIQGQSWGGYQVAYMITQTSMFKAAMAGAPVANMFSAYGGIRWQTGLNRAFQYEKGQSRIGKSIWESPLRYIENSPLFWADKVRTPLLMMHNDGDGAVPWYQGIEMFVALRRLGKEVYLLNYNGDEHNPTKRANQKDVARRMQEFFDHHLKGAPAPDWMKEGIPYRLKGRDQFPSNGEKP